MKTPAEEIGQSLGSKAPIEGTPVTKGQLEPVTKAPIIPVAIPKTLEPETVTSQNLPALKLKRQRSPAQIAWSKLLGKNSTEFKKRKQKILNNINPDRRNSYDQRSDQEQNSQERETSRETSASPSQSSDRLNSHHDQRSDENKFISWYIIIPAGLAAACIIWCKWGKYRVFKLSAPETSIGETSDTKIKLKNYRTF